MIRGLRVLRYVVIAFALVLITYKVSTRSINLGDYASLSRAKETLRGTTGGFTSHAQADRNANGGTNSGTPHLADIPELTPDEAKRIGNPDPDAGNAKSAPEPAPAGEKAIVGEKANATFVTLARNSDLWSLVDSMRQVEDRFNHRFHYDWVFLNDEEFTDEFKAVTTQFCSGKTSYGKIPKEHWSFPDYIDQEKAALAREDMAQRNIIYGGSVSYRHMCRFESGFFWRNPALDNYRYYWRVEPHIKLFCDIEYDVFKYMQDNGKKYGFTISLYEYIDTIPTLWRTVKEFMQKFPQYIHKNNMLDWISNDGGETYNLCHFWSNFEVGDLDFWRSDAYRAYFDYLDHAGGFFYERWGDAPVHSIAAALMLDKNEIHFFEDIGYWHVPFQHCPTQQADRLRLRCTCPHDSTIEQSQQHIFTWRGYSCTPRYYKVKNLERPKSWIDHTD